MRSCARRRSKLVAWLLGFTAMALATEWFWVREVECSISISLGSFMIQNGVFPGIDLLKDSGECDMHFSQCINNKLNETRNGFNVKIFAGYREINSVLSNRQIRLAMDGWIRIVWFSSPFLSHNSLKTSNKIDRY